MDPSMVVFDYKILQNQNDTMIKSHYQTLLVEWFF